MKKLFAVIGVGATLLTGFAAGWLRGIIDTTNAMARDPEKGHQIIDEWHEKVISRKEGKEA